jgi:hypothetical protein
LTSTLITHAHTLEHTHTRTHTLSLHLGYSGPHTYTDRLLPCTIPAHGSSSALFTTCCLVIIRTDASRTSLATHMSLRVGRRGCTVYDIPSELARLTWVWLCVFVLSSCLRDQLPLHCPHDRPFSIRARIDCVTVSHAPHTTPRSPLQSPPLPIHHYR